MTKEELENRFDYHAPNDERVRKHQLIRENLLSVAKLIIHNTPEGREQSLAITKLEEAMFWANAAIARESE